MVGGAPIDVHHVHYAGGLTPKVMIAAVTAASAGLLFGFDTGVTGGVTTMATFQAKFFPEVYYRTTHPTPTSPYCTYDDQVLQTFNSTMYLVGMVGACVASYVTRYWGRRGVLLVGCLSFLLGGALMAGAVDLGMLFAGRVFVGLGIGLSNSAAPLLLSELAPAKWRGMLNTMFQFAITLGILIASIINFGVRDMEKGWRLTLAIAEVPALLLLFGLLILPESPNSLLERGHAEKARAVLQSVRGDVDVTEEYDDLVDAVNLANRHTLFSSFRALFSRKFLPAAIISATLQMFQQFTGINAIMYYTGNLFNSIGKGRTDSLRNIVIVNAVNCGSTIVAVTGSDRLGRKFLLLEGCTQMIITEVIIGVVMACKFSNTPNLIVSEQVAQAVLAMLCLFVAGFAWSWGPLGWLIPTEVNGLETRVAAQTLTVVTNFLFSFVIGQSFLSMLCSMRWGVFLFFAGFNAMAATFVLFLLPETRGVPIERVQILLAQHPLWNPLMGAGADEIIEFETTRTTRHRQMHAEQGDVAERAKDASEASE